jgi:hypothetical protein
MISREKQTPAGLSDSVHPAGSRASEALSALSRLLPKFTTRVLKFRASTRRSSARHQISRQSWDGRFADDALALLSCDTNWDTVAVDDLIFLLPALTASSTCHTEGATAADYFHAACVDFEARIAGGLIPIGASALRIRRILETQFRRSTVQAVANARVDAASACAYSVRQEDLLSDEDAVLGAIYGRVHPVYAAPELVYLHESLMTAAWLGHLVAGRDAWLRPTIAEPLGMLLAEPQRAAAASISVAAAFRTDPVANLISAHADAVGGAEFLSRAAATVCETRQPRLIRATARQLVTSGG